jgi:hypothetical protein
MKLFSISFLLPRRERGRRQVPNGRIGCFDPSGKTGNLLLRLVAGSEPTANFPMERSEGTEQYRTIPRRTLGQYCSRIRECSPDFSAVSYWNWPVQVTIWAGNHSWRLGFKHTQNMCNCASKFLYIFCDQLHGSRSLRVLLGN